MNLVFISPHFPENFYNFSVALKKAGITVLGIADCPYDSLRNELKYSLTEYYRVENMNDYSKLYQACNYFKNKYGAIDRLESHNEYWLETDARLRTDFNIPGIKSSDIEDMKYKSKMKKRFIAAGVSVAPGIVYKDNPDEVKLFVKEHGFPFVAKPDNGVGAADTFKIHDDRELSDFFNKNIKCDYFIEKFVNGTIYSFDGLVDKDGKVVYSTSHVFENGIMEVVNGDLDLYYYSLLEIPEKLKKYGTSILQIFDIKERFFHIEFFKTKDDFIALEVNMRPPGGLTLDMFNFASDIDMYQGWANVIAYNKLGFDYRKIYHTMYFGRKFNKNYVNYHDDIIIKYGNLISFHDYMNPVFRTVMGNYGYVARSKNLKELQELVKFAQITKE